MISKLGEMFKLCKTSSTGISAVNIEGCTIHSMLRDIMFDKYDEWKNADYDALVIDEISMLSGVLFDQIYTGIKKITEKREKPICFIVCGDVMQLPPVNSTSGYFFNAHHFEDFEMNSYTAKLSECKRKDNKEFIDVLERVRIASCTDNDIRYIQNMKHNQIDENNAVYMSSTNEVVNKINKRYFDANKNEKFDIKKQIHLSVKHGDNGKAAQITFNKDDFDDKTKTKINDLIDEAIDISIKKDLLVMVTKNINVRGGLCNGTVGRIESINKDDTVTIVTTNKKTYTINMISKILRFQIGKDIYKLTVNYMPLRQCNAITIHKSQSSTIDGNAILDCKGIFEAGMFYVGLSRIKDPSKLKVINFSRNIEALKYVTENKYESYIERKLVEDTSEKEMSLKLKSEAPIFEKIQ